MFKLIESIELVVRQHLNIPNIQTYQPETNLREKILKEGLGSHSIMSCWETIAHSIPTRYEEYSTELLRVIIDLWIAIRGNSFQPGMRSTVPSC